MMSDEKSEDTFVWQRCLITTKNWSQIFYKTPGTCRNRTKKSFVKLPKLTKLGESAPTKKSEKKSEEKNVGEKIYFISLGIARGLSYQPTYQNKDPRGVRRNLISVGRSLNCGWF